MLSERRIRSRLQDAPASAAFWCGGIAAVVGFGGSTLSPLILKIVAIVLGVGLGLFAMLLFTMNRHFDPASWSEWQPARHNKPPTDRTTEPD